MHDWFKRPIRFGDPQPPWKDIWIEAGSRKFPGELLPKEEWREHVDCRAGVFDAPSGKSYRTRAVFEKAVEDGAFDDDGEHWLFAMFRDGRIDFDCAVTNPRESRDIENEIEELEYQIQELERRKENLRCGV